MNKHTFTPDDVQTAIQTITDECGAELLTTDKSEWLDIVNRHPATYLRSLDAYMVFSKVNVTEGDEIRCDYQYEVQTIDGVRYTTSDDRLRASEALDQTMTNLAKELKALQDAKADVHDGFKYMVALFGLGIVLHIGSVAVQMWHLWYK